MCKSKLFYLFIFFIFSCFYGCNTTTLRKNGNLQHGYYFWKSTYSTETDSLLNDSHADFIYHRVFDVVWKDNTIHPTNSLSNYQTPSIDSKVRPFIPVVYIQNEVFQSASKEQLNALSDHIWKRFRMVLFRSFYAKEVEKIEGDLDIQEGYGPEFQRKYDTTALEKINSEALIQKALQNIKEFQIDCDWTPSTKEKYFQFLKSFKQKIKQRILSCTLRLYPYKYRSKMGIPPVDKATLMCYNVNSVRTHSQKNNLFDLQEIKRYLNVIQAYPIPLDYALPIFDWTAIYSKNQLIDLYPGTSSYNESYYSQDFNLLLDDSIKGVREYEVLTDHYYDGDFSKGDIIHQERLNWKELKELTALLKQLNKNKHARLILFHFDETNYNTNKTKIDEVFTAF